jgi:probable lipoprotein NlpC
MKASIKASCFLLLIVLFAACSSRKYTPSTTQAAHAADAMASLNNKELYKFITDWTGVKYRLGGLDKNGIDCSGFALLLEKDIYGLKLPRRSVEQADAINSKSMNQLKEGDLIFFSFGGGQVDHVGVYLNKNYFVHASPSRGIIVDDLSIASYQRAIVKAGTIKN